MSSSSESVAFVPTSEDSRNSGAFLAFLNREKFHGLKVGPVEGATNVLHLKAQSQIDEILASHPDQAELLKWKLQKRR